MKHQPKWLKYLIPALIALGGCTPDTSPVSSPSGQLDQLSLPGNSPAASASPTASASPATNAATSRASRLLVWEVSPKGQTQPKSHLVGTVHAPLAQGYSLPAEYLSRLKSSTAFYMEADVEQADSIVQQVVNLAIDSSQNLEMRLGDEYWQKLLTRLAQNRLTTPAEALRLLRPWYINLLLGSAPEDPPIDPNTILDLVLRDQARQAGIEIRYLEQPIDQINALRAVSEAEHLRLLKDNLDQGLAKFLSERTQVFDLYNRGDLAGFDRAEAEARQESSEYFEHVLKARNQRWLQTLVPVLGKQSVLIAVGTLHLAGDQGLVQQLQAQGFDVRPVQVDSVP
ncbi:MAG: hypothetical protein CVV27_03985 [Candidatus Melainabacteria bacterium HGW-Melainabacteria-1]|nr:MAG: hypothetical protein CVV27_03985 [Candidatus Melainabacteria bacterium HGW-Melainabacteria-1]